MESLRLFFSSKVPSYFKFIIVSYVNISPYCLGTTTEIESFKPYAASISAVQPATPKTVMINLALYLKIFLVVTFDEKFILFHINGIFSKNIRFPCFGALGLIKVAGFSFSSL